MAISQGFGQVLPFQGSGLSRKAERRPPPLPSQGSPRAGGARPEERQQALDAVHEALSAALTADMALCRLRQQQALGLCAGRPHAAWAARQEIHRMLGVDIVARHLCGCEKRRRLQREIEDLATRLHQMAAPETA